MTFIHYIRLSHIATFVLVLTILIADFSNSYSLDSKRRITQYVHRNWMVDNGLPQNTITSVSQSPNKYLWFGTLAGLVRFDGVNFKTFDREFAALGATPRVTSTAYANGTMYFGNEFGLFSIKEKIIKKESILGVHKDELITRLFSENNTALWISTNKGLYRYTSNGLQNIFSVSSLPRGFKFSFSQTSNYDVYIGAHDGVYKFSNGFLSKIPSKYFEAVVTAIAVDANNTVWIGSSSGLGRLDNRGETIITANEGLASDYIQTLFADSDNTLWVGTNQGLSRIAGNEVSTAPTTMFASDAIISIFEDAEHNIWVGTFSNGLHQLRDGAFATISVQEGLSDNFVRAIAETDDGSLWVGASNGLNRIRNNTVRFYSFADGIAGNEINALCKGSDGTLWIGGASGYITAFRNDKFSIVPISPPEKPAPVYSMLEYSRDEFWIGSNNEVLILKNGNIKKITARDGLPNGIVSSMERDNNGNIWIICFGGGVAKYSKGKIVQKLEKSNGLTSPFVTALHSDKNGDAILGTDGSGIVYFHNKKYYSLGTEQGLPNNSIFHIESDDKGNLWCSTKRGIFSVPKIDVIECALGKRQKVRCSNFGIDDGLKTVECNSGFFPAGWKTKNGTLYFPTVKGLSFINAKKSYKNSVQPKAVVEAIVLPNSIEDIYDNIPSFPQGTTKCEIVFTATSLSAPLKNRFRYKLEGVDDEWIENNGQRSASYSNLSPGKYVFSILATNNDGVWGKEPTILQFSVEPYFYQTLWFRIFFIALIFALLYAFYRYRLQSLQRRKIELEGMVEERTNDLWAANQELHSSNKRLEDTIAEIETLNQNLLGLNNEKNEFMGIAAHDLKNPLSGIILTTQNIKRFLSVLPPDELKAMMEKIEVAAIRMRDIVMNLLDVNAIESGMIHLDVTTFNLSGVVQEAIQEYQQRAQEKNIKIIFDAQNSLEYIVLADWAKTVEIVDNLLSNSIKFSPFDKNVYFKIRNEPHSAILEIRDEGPGVSADDQKKLFGKFVRLSAQPTNGENSTGLGLSIVKKLAEMMRGKVWCNSVDGKGATFYVELPKPI